MITTSLTPWWVYIVECRDGTYYTGCTSHLDERIATHNLGKGAKYTRGRLPVKMIFAEQTENHSAALKREFAIKMMTKLQKKILIKQFNPA